MTMPCPTCPTCGAPSTLRHEGTVDGASFFQRHPTYRIAEGHGKDLLPVFRCPRCGQGFSPPGVSEEELEEFYRAQPPDDLYLAAEGARRRTARSLLASVRAHATPPGTLLDLGCGPGFLLDEARGDGWEVSGIELSPWSCARARELLGAHAVIEGGTARLSEFPSENTTVVTMLDLLEHLTDPRMVLKEVFRVLRPGGLLVLTTPRFDSMVARLQGKRWHCLFPAHLSYFTLAALERLLTETGFRLVRTKAHVRHLPLWYLLLRLAPGAFGPRAPALRRRLSWNLPVALGDEFEAYALRLPAR